MSPRQSRLAGFFALSFLLCSATAGLATLVIAGAFAVVLWLFSAGFLLLAIGWFALWVLS